MRNYNKNLLALAVSSVLMFSAAPAMAQTQGHVAGQVESQDGANISSAKVVIRNLDTGLVRETLTDATVNSVSRYYRKVSTRLLFKKTAIAQLKTIRSVLPWVGVRI